jgi:glycosyltransferase involved in cell wall biosynthesis
MLRQQHRDAMLTIAGEGPERGRLEARCRELDLTGAVHFAGFVENPYPLMAAADLLILSSRHDAFPNVVLEALACGTPVVATDCPGAIRDLIEPGVTGWLAQPEDPIHLARTIDEAWRHRPGIQPGVIRDFVMRKFGTAGVTAAYERVFFEVSRETGKTTLGEDDNTGAIAKRTAVSPWNRRRDVGTGRPT